MNYVEITIDEDGMQFAGLYEFKKAKELNTNKGESFEKYIIKGEKGCHDCNIDRL